MTVCPSCKRRKATADDMVAYQYSGYLCWQGPNCYLPPAPLAFRHQPVTVSGPTGEDWIEEGNGAPLEDLHYGNNRVRILNALHNSRYRTVADVLNADRQSLLRIRNLGGQSLRDLYRALERFGYTPRWHYRSTVDRQRRPSWPPPCHATACPAPLPGER